MANQQAFASRVAMLEGSRLGKVEISTFNRSKDGERTGKALGVLSANPGTGILFAQLTLGDLFYSAASPGKSAQPKP